MRSTMRRGRKIRGIYISCAIALSVAGFLNCPLAANGMLAPAQESANARPNPPTTFPDWRLVACADDIVVGTLILPHTPQEVDAATRNAFAVIIGVVVDSVIKKAAPLSPSLKVASYYGSRTVQPHLEKLERQRGRAIVFLERQEGGPREADGVAIILGQDRELLPYRAASAAAVRSEVLRITTTASFVI